MDKRARFETVGEYTPDSLIAGNAHLLVGCKISLPAGVQFRRGTVLGKGIDGVIMMAGAADDPPGLWINPEMVLAESVDGREATEALVYLRGDFNRNALILNAKTPVEQLLQELRRNGITVLPAVA